MGDGRQALACPHAAGAPARFAVTAGKAMLLLTRSGHRNDKFAVLLGDEVLARAG
jgi:hypothetical protein